MHKRTSRLLLMVWLATLLATGCAGPVVVGGAAAGGMVAHDRRSTGTMIDDQGVELAAAGALRTDERLHPGSHIEVTCFNRRCLLTGQVPTEDLRDHAVWVAGSDRRIRGLQNELAIAEPASLAARARDGWITGKVKSRLLAADDVPGMRIKVVTEARIVFLMGLVHRAEARAAAREARRVEGVEKVVKAFEYLD